MEPATAGAALNPAFRLRGAAVGPPPEPPPEPDGLREAEQLCQERRFREALGALNRVVLRDPRNPQAWKLVAGSHLGRGEFAEALSAARTAADLTADSEPLRLATAALVGLGRPEDAAAQAGQAVRREPHDWRNHVEHARALIHLPGRIGEARSAARVALNLAPHKVTPHLVAGQVELAAGDVEQAAQAFRQVFTIDPANPAAYNELARLRLHGGPGSGRGSRRWPLARSRRAR